MDDWKAPEYWKRVACIMMIRAEFKNSEILAAAQCSLNTLRCELTKVPQTVMVFGCVSSKGDVMPPDIFKKGLNSDGYIHCCQVLGGEGDCRKAIRVAQDSASGCQNFHDFTSPNICTPPNSPNCNPMDYYVWGAVAKNTNRTACNTKDELIARIKLVFGHLSKDTVKAACSRFRSRLEVVVEAQGGFFE